MPTLANASTETAPLAANPESAALSTVDFTDVNTRGAIDRAQIFDSRDYGHPTRDARTVVVWDSRPFDKHEVGTLNGQHSLVPVPRPVDGSVLSDTAARALTSGTPASTPNAGTVTSGGLGAALGCSVQPFGGVARTAVRTPPPLWDSVITRPEGF